MVKVSRTAIGALAAALMTASFAGPTAAQSVTVGQADRDLARTIVAEFVGFRTSKGRGQVPLMIDAITARLRAAGFAEGDIQTVPLEIDGEKTAGLVVRYRGSGESDRKPIALLAHMDVVDAVPEAWSTDPFKPVEKDGYLYGRGSIDNKAGAALLVTTFIRLKRSGWTPDRDILLAFSGDEETGMKTTRTLAKHPWLSTAEYALNSDAGIGRMDKDGANATFSIQSAEKMTATFNLIAKNPGGHSSAPRADNALYDAAAAILAVRAMTFPVEFNEISRVMVADLAARNPGPYGDALKRLMTDPQDEAARRVAAGRVESNLLWTTCVPTMMSAGNAPNALPSNATVTVNCRVFPGTTASAVQARLEAAIANPAIKVELQGEAVPSPVSPMREDLFASIRRAVHANYPGAPVKPSMSSGGTDGREFRSAGIPTYGAGSLALGPLDDNRAHGANERLPLASFDKELLFWETLLTDLAGNKRQ